jgi:uncharacterized membrane protein HdeD (DUF308 family)
MFRGAAAILFGLAALLWPGMTLASLVLLFGVYALIDGIATIAIGTRHRARERAWVVLLEGLAGVGLGSAVLLWTRVAAELLVVLIALWAIATGILEVFVVVRLRHDLRGEVLFGVAGMASLLLGFAILFWPNVRPVALAGLLGSYTLVFGTSMLLQALRFRRAMRRIGAHDHHFDPKPRAV